MDYWKRLCPSHIYIVNPTTLIPPSIINKEYDLTTCEKFQISHTNAEGDFAVAPQQSIAAGSLILQEEPYAFEIRDDLEQRTCPGCLSTLDHNITISTTRCRQASCTWNLVYCSPSCETRYWFLLHMYVCPFRTEFRSKHSLLLAFQIWTKSIISQQSSFDSFSSTQSNNQLDSLVDNMDQHAETDLDRYRQEAKQISRLFIFSMNETKDMEDKLVRYQALIRCNGFGVQRRLISNYDASYTTGTNSLSSSSSSVMVSIGTVATAIYPLASKFNHSCQPNVIALFLGTQLQLRALRLIHPGQRLSISYGPLAANLPKSKRQQQLLDHYFFTCHCQACQVTPDQSISPECEHIYLCSSCKYTRISANESKCPQCGITIDWNKIHNMEETIETYRQHGLWDKVLKYQLNIYHDQALPIGKTYDQLARICHSTHQSKEAVLYCERSLRVVQSVYGESSPEAAEEMFKLCGLLITSRHDLTKAQYWIKKTRDLYYLLGLDQQLKDDIEELNAMIACI
ncbi:uncharacterized protein BX664DRAFT_322368 [Halteromyces radiatus]|uniref:uncharacterized protein n=1 Tax=Halteromyces radiatus TaxID=101107 RepID=UPI00221FE01D|nr:uncharacterized protein BX664DRAFT_322368 [Halteromyces radiatus]KAI8099908.1 hypothetical protein BX664DRAFT_322368 [Halteromyces radiatus]